MMQLILDLIWYLSFYDVEELFRMMQLILDLIWYLLF